MYSFMNKLPSSKLFLAPIRSFSTKVSKTPSKPVSSKPATPQASLKHEEPKKRLLLGRPGNTLNMGIVGLANVGKSSTFNLLSKLNVPAENYPFCTIDPNTANAIVPDDRFDHLCKIWSPKKEIRPTLQIIDIAGLVPGASEGLGLGNAFLSHIQAVDGIYHVVRAFEDPRIAHTEGRVDPIKDMEIITEELIKKDQQLLEKKLAGLARRSHDKAAKEENNVLLKVKELFAKKVWAKDYDWDEKEVMILNTHLFLTSKSVIYLLNVSAQDYIQGKNQYIDQINKWINERVPGTPITYSVEYENSKELVEKNNNKSEITQIIKTGYKCLDLIYYFTCGEDEVRAWTVRSNTKAPQASSLIHSDFEKGFQGVEITKFEDIKALGDQALAKYKSKTKTHGKDYIIEDGDICVFKINYKVIKK